MFFSGTVGIVMTAAHIPSLDSEHPATNDDTLR